MSWLPRNVGSAWDGYNCYYGEGWGLAVSVLVVATSLSIGGYVILPLQALTAQMTPSKLKGDLLGPHVKGALLSPEQVGMATNSGVAVVQGDTLTTGYQYAKGLLKVNDRELDASFIDAALSRADEQLQDLLSSMKTQR